MLYLFKELLLNSFVTSVVAYAVSMSMALILAEGENYEVDPNQEFLAHVNYTSKIKNYLLVILIFYRPLEISSAAFSRASCTAHHCRGAWS
jgi:hypothetical protein